MSVTLQHAIDKLRSHARCDLQRFCPLNYFHGREHSLIADFNLTWPLLQAPATNRLTAREVAAATALKDLSVYENRYQKIWKDTKPVKDNLGKGYTELSESESREIYTLLEIFYCSALSYMQAIGAPSLIKVFEQAAPKIQVTLRTEIEPGTILDWSFV
ncbi:MAG: hypothetical protein V3R32_04085 [Nitrosomonadaceae bacterium]